VLQNQETPEAEQLLKQVFDIYLASFGSGDRRTAAAAGNLDILKKLNAERAAATQQQSATTSPAGGPPAGHSGAPMDPQPAIAAPKQQWRRQQESSKQTQACNKLCGLHLITYQDQNAIGVEQTSRRRLPEMHRHFN